MDFSKLAFLLGNITIFVSVKHLYQSNRMKLYSLLFLFILPLIGCNAKVNSEKNNKNDKPIIIGALNTEAYYPMIKNKRVAILSNNTGMINENQHLLDKLIEDSINVVTILSPEHGFRGKADAGEKVASSVDIKTGIPISSLYNGKELKPSKETMDQFDVLIFDIQDVGLRFYTYYITMFRLMDACAIYNKKMVILDMPNPNGHYVDGPILDMKYKSGVGYLPIPVVHGMTLGELALMINGENWLPQNRTCNLSVIPCGNYTHQTIYEVPISPSPNLRTARAIYMYPATCLFEGTVVSLGRGTDLPFEVYGHPKMKDNGFSFTPRSVEGAKNPPLLNQLCYGVNLSNIPLEDTMLQGFHLNFVIDAYNQLNMGDKFFTPFFEKLVGVGYIREMIKDGKSNDEIRDMWANDIKQFKEQRKPYLLYSE